jgi:hypothetical protein
MRRQIDRAAREHATLATRVPVVRERIPSRDADDDANIVLPLNKYDVTEFNLVHRHDWLPRTLLNLSQDTAYLLRNFFQLGVAQ